MNTVYSQKNNLALDNLIQEASYCNSRREFLSVLNQSDFCDDFPSNMSSQERSALLACIWDSVHLPQNADSLTELWCAASFYESKKEYLSDYGVNDVWGDLKSYYYILFLRLEILSRIWDTAHSDPERINAMIDMSIQRITNVYAIDRHLWDCSTPANMLTLLAHAIDLDEDSV